jgi:hypothetical protein
MIIVKEYQVGIMVDDLPDELSFADALVALQKTGMNLRLPTLDELILVDELFFKIGKGNFKPSFYWSSQLDNSGKVNVYNFAKHKNYKLRVSYTPQFIDVHQFNAINRANLDYNYYHQYVSPIINRENQTKCWVRAFVDLNI